MAGYCPSQFLLSLRVYVYGPDNNKSQSCNRGFIIWPPFTIPVFIVIEFRFAKLVLIFVVSTAVKIYRRSVLGTCSTCGSVAEDSAGNLPLSVTKGELNELLSWLPWKYFFPLWGSHVDRNMKSLCISIARQGNQ